MVTTALIDSNNKIVDICPNKSYSITANDTDDNVPLCSVVVCNGGNLKVMFENDEDAILWTVPDGYIIIGRIKRILADGLTASNIIAIKTE